MASETDPYRTLGLARGASLDEVKRAYRRLAKANHPDAAGETALPRFLAIQAAYDQIAGPDAGPRRGGNASEPRRAWDADPDRAGATNRAYGGRTRRTRPPPGPRPAGPDPSRRPPGSGRQDRRDRPDRPPNKATLGSTSYDGADAEPFEPDWGGASWYGTTSGTYWTLNPKEYADPRKHGPEYQARARRARDGRPVEAGAGDDVPLAAPETAPDAPDAPDAPPRPGRRPTPPPPPTHTTSSWWEATAAEPAPAAPQASAPPTEGSAPGADSIADLSTDAVIASVRAWLDAGHPGVGARMSRAVIGWAPIALGIGWLAGEITGCGRFAADCDPSVAPVSWFAQLAALGLALLVPRLARVAAVATIATIGAVVPAAVLLLATSDPQDSAAGRSILGVLMVIAWLAGIAYGLVREVRTLRHETARPPPAAGPDRPVS